MTMLLMYLLYFYVLNFYYYKFDTNKNLKNSNNIHKDINIS